MESIRLHESITICMSYNEHLSIGLRAQNEAPAFTRSDTGVDGQQHAQHPCGSGL
jgi:hypothetical protein